MKLRKHWNNCCLADTVSELYVKMLLHGTLPSLESGYCKAFTIEHYWSIVSTIFSCKSNGVISCNCLAKITNRHKQWLTRERYIVFQWRIHNRCCFRMKGRTCSLWPASRRTWLSLPLDTQRNRSHRICLQ